MQQPSDLDASTAPNELVMVETSDETKEAGPPRPPADNDDSAEAGPPRPSMDQGNAEAEAGPPRPADLDEECTTQGPRKKRKALDFEAVYLRNLPCGEMYEKSYMHRDVVTDVIVTSNDFIITASCDGQVISALPCNNSLRNGNTHTYFCPSTLHPFYAV